MLITNLLEKEKYPQRIFKKLYHLRWGVEEDFKQLKHSVKLELFSGKSALSVLQDIHAKVLTKNITTLLINQANRRMERMYGHRKHQYQVNIKQAISKTKHSVIQILNSANPLRIIRSLVTLFASIVEPIRPNRSFPRKRSVGTRNVNGGTYKPTR